MTPAHTDSPLRRSEFRDAAQDQLRPNDDEEERRQARRRTLHNTTAETDVSTKEQTENLKKVLEIYHENKLSRDNAWSLSVIDTLTTLLEKHHKSLNNFTVAGSSLEASTKVYGLRVDSVHTDVLRMSAGLNARKFRENIHDDDADSVATGGEGGADPNSSAGTGIDPAAGTTADHPAGQKNKQKRQRKPVATVTKNKETLNANLDTVPLQDPVFGKLNSIVGSINASNRLMNNMLQTANGELRLRQTHRFWEVSSPEENCDFTAPAPVEDMAQSALFPCDGLCRLSRYENLLLRPVNSGYIITDTPEPSPDDKEDTLARPDDLFSERPGAAESPDNIFADVHVDPSMAFDINAECEPLPQLNAYTPMIAVDEQDYDDFTTEEHNAIGLCRGLRKAPVVIADLRPIDSTSNLEYSYRPVEKISQFWAGPSHWKFRRTRHRPSTMTNNGNSHQVEKVGRTLNPRNRRVNALQAKKRNKVHFGEVHDEQFVKLDAKYKSRKINFQKKWDPKKLRLPIDLQLNANNILYKRIFAPALPVGSADVHNIDDDNLTHSSQPASYDGGTDDLALPSNDHHFNADDEFGGEAIGGMIDGTQALGDGEAPECGSEGIDHLVEDDQANTNAVANDTVLEIATDFENAPRQVTKIVVPFAKRAKVIDMKSLKRTCTLLITQQIKNCAIDESLLLQHPLKSSEHYAGGEANFRKTFETLPSLLTPTMAEGLTPSIALYSVLHLANDHHYRLIQEDSLENFRIRQVLEE